MRFVDVFDLTFVVLYGRTTHFDCPYPEKSIFRTKNHIIEVQFTISM